MVYPKTSPPLAMLKLHATFFATDNFQIRKHLIWHNLQIPQTPVCLPLDIFMEVPNFILCRHSLGTVTYFLSCYSLQWDSPALLTSTFKSMVWRPQAVCEHFVGGLQELLLKVVVLTTFFFQPPFRLLWSLFIKPYHIFWISHVCV